MLEVPAAIPVTIPVVAPIVATIVFEELHVPPETVEVYDVAPPTQIFWVPLITPGFGGAATVTLSCDDGLLPTQPPVPVTVYFIAVVPADIPVTMPAEFTVAIAVFAELQVPPEALEVKLVVEPTHIFWFPLSVPAFGAVVTAMVFVTGPEAHGNKAAFGVKT